MGWPRIGKAGVSTRVAGVSFRAFDERAVAGLPVALAALLRGLLLSAGVSPAARLGVL
jgi:hypothetical protein